MKARKVAFVTWAAVFTVAFTRFSAEPPLLEEEAGLDYFAKLMPVLRHPRCINCHGALNPLADTTHEGGVIDANVKASGELEDNQVCLGCHTAASRLPDEPTLANDQRWRLPPPEMKWAEKDLRSTCIQLQNWVKTRGNEAAREHLGFDPLIQWGFEGRAAGVRDPKPPAPPPIDLETFTELFREWVTKDRGNLGCKPRGEWSGTISVTTARSEMRDSTHKHNDVTVQMSTKEADTVRYDVIVKGNSANARVSGLGIYDHNETRKSINCVVPKLRKYTVTRYSGSGTVSFEFKQLSGGKYQLLFAAPAYSTKISDTDETEGVECGPGFGHKGGSNTTTYSVEHDAMTLSAIVAAPEELDMPGANGESVPLVVAKGRQTHKILDRVVTYEWDLVKKPTKGQ